MSNTKPTIAVAMSGGVDSSVTAALLLERGYRVIGFMLRLWGEPERSAENACCTLEATAIARGIAEQLGIPFHLIDARTAFRQTVVQYFIDEYLAGNTPNPCLLCNRAVRWGVLWEHAHALGADLMATGHYARLKRDPDGTVHLLRGLDAHKDQSYVLSRLTQEQLRHTILPIGEFTKPEVRRMAVKFGLPVAQRPDSQDLCFAAGDYRAFLRRHAPESQKPGPILDLRGNEIGKHEGLAFYTIGQRRGLGIAAAEPLYVIAKDVKRNALIVGPRSALGRQSLTAVQANWIVPPPADEFKAEVQIRYTARPIPAVVRLEGEGKFSARLETPARDITPGQAAVIYLGEECLGSGIIAPY